MNKGSTNGVQKGLQNIYEFPNVIGLRNTIADKLKTENNYCF